VATIGEDFVAYLLADSDIASAVTDRVHYLSVPQNFDDLYVWIGKAAQEHERCFDDGTGDEPFRQFWDIECIGQTLASVDLLAGYVRALDNDTGTFGAGTVQRIWIADHAEDYVPRGINSDEGFCIAALQAEIVGYTPGS